MIDQTQTPSVELMKAAEAAAPDEFMALLREAARLDDEAQARARAARSRLNGLVTVGLSRSDINNRRMAEATGIKERDLYKRKDRL